MYILNDGNTATRAANAIAHGKRRGLPRRNRCTMQCRPPTMPLKSPPGRNQGRKPLSVDSPTVIVSIKMTDAQRAAYKRKGGAAWMRNKIDEIT